MRKNAESISLRWSPPKDLAALLTPKWFGFWQWYGVVWYGHCGGGLIETRKTFFFVTFNFHQMLNNVFIGRTSTPCWIMSSWVQSFNVRFINTLSSMICMLKRGYNFGCFNSCQELLDVHLKIISLFLCWSYLLWHTELECWPSDPLRPMFLSMQLDLAE